MSVVQEYPKVFVAGETGMVGSAIKRRLEEEKYNVIPRPEKRVDLRDQRQAMDLFEEMRPDWVYLAAAKVGGIHANSAYPADFIYDNIMIQTNVLEAARRYGVSKLLFLGSSCIYPRNAPQPMKEEYLLSGYLEPTNEPYAVAKISGIVCARSYNIQYGTNFISVMPTNLYGPHDNFDLNNSHVIPALMRKAHEAKTREDKYLEIWGTGEPRREFLHVDDLADACVFLMEEYQSNEIINIGVGEDISIRDLAALVARVVGFEGELRFNSDMPDGTPRKLLDVSKLTQLGWRAKITLEEGLAMTYDWYLKNHAFLRK
jgi:GDP-L-fucose synthase